ncbi:MAG TPA: hypothetical protein VNK43_04935 [Gemmatimonadales bacterium]|nr:hypothetical protein [Gemmatimonadales bacterium]
MRTVLAPPKSVNGSGLDIPRLCAEHLHLDIEVVKNRLAEVRALEAQLLEQINDLEAMLVIAKRLCNNPGTLSLSTFCEVPPVKLRDTRAA